MLALDGVIPVLSSLTGILEPDAELRLVVDGVPMNVNNVTVQLTDSKGDQKELFFYKIHDHIHFEENISIYRPLVEEIRN